MYLFCPCSKQADTAQAALDSVVSAHPALTAEKVRFERLHDASDWNKWRRIPASSILKLSGKS